MAKSVIESVLDKHGKFFTLLCLLIILILVYPALEFHSGFAIILAIIMTSVVVATDIAVSKTRSMLTVMGLLGFLLVVVTWTDTFAENLGLTTLRLVLTVIFFAYATFLLLRCLLAKRRITKDTIFGALCAYLLIGIAWTSVFILLAQVVPDSFASTASAVPALVSESDFLFYSFSSLTTLGLGDISPVSSYARILTIVETIIGVLYVATLMALIVGAHLTQKRRSRS